MFDWIENNNGNYVCIFGEDDLMTVFENKNGKWSGIYDDNLLKVPHSSPEEAMEAMERFYLGATELVQKINSSWDTAKKGGKYKQNSQGTVTVKQAKSGKWYITVNGILVKDLWLDTKEDAIIKANELMS